MPEVSTAVTEAFCQPQGTDVSDTNPCVVPFITEGLLTHFFCYYDKPDRRNILWFLEHVNKHKHLMRVQYSKLGVTSNLSPILRSSSYNSEEAKLQLFSSCSNTHCIELTMLKYYLSRILGSCSGGKEAKKQWVLPYESEVAI